MEIRTAAEGLLHGLVIGNVRHDTELDLAVVRIHEDPVVLRHEHLAHLTAQGRSDGDILQIGLGGGQAAGGGDRVLEGGADTAVGTDLLLQAVGVSALELGEHTVVHDGLHHGMLILQLFQHLCIGGVAGLGLFDWGQTQLFKEQFPQLTCGIDIEFAAVGLEDQLLAIGNTLGQHFAKILQRLLIHTYTGMLHPCQHIAKRQLHFKIELVTPLLLQLWQEAVVKRIHGGRPTGKDTLGEGVGGRSEVQIGGAELLQFVFTTGGIQQIGRHSRIEDKALGINAFFQ